MTLLLINTFNIYLILHFFILLLSLELNLLFLNRNVSKNYAETLKYLQWDSVHSKVVVGISNI